MFHFISIHNRELLVIFILTLMFGLGGVFALLHKDLKKAYTVCLTVFVISAIATIVLLLAK